MGMKSSRTYNHDHDSTRNGGFHHHHTRFQQQGPNGLSPPRQLDSLGGSGKNSTVVVISPYEANALLRIIRKSSKVRLHVYAPRATSSMRSFSNLTFHTIPDALAPRAARPWSSPAHIRTELNLFAGQLHFDSREEYERVCQLLAIPIAHPGAEYCEMDGFVPPQHRTGPSSPFAKSKIDILKVLISLRRKGMGYNRTHLGQILNASPLSEETLSSISS
jgi:hypothetical protein